MAGIVGPVDCITVEFLTIILGEGIPNKGLNFAINYGHRKIIKDLLVSEYNQVSSFMSSALPGLAE